MENLLFSFNVVFPLFLMMCLGTFLKRVNLFNDNFLKTANKFVFKVLLPILLFYNIYDSDISVAFNAGLVAFAVVVILLLVSILFLIIPRIEQDNRNRGVIIQGLMRSNFILFGIPLSINIFGDAGKGVASMLIAFIVPLYNFLCVVILEWFSREKINVKRVILEILKNHMIIASLIAIFMSLLNIRLPFALEKTVSDISKITTPFAIIILGGGFHIEDVHKNLRNLIIVCVGKLALIPSVVMLVAVLLGFRGVELGALFSMIASPVAVSSYAMAAQCNANDELAGQIVVSTTVLSSVTIFAFIYVFKTLALF